MWNGIVAQFIYPPSPLPAVMTGVTGVQDWIKFIFEGLFEEHPSTSDLACAGMYDYGTYRPGEHSGGGGDLRREI